MSESRPRPFEAQSGHRSVDVVLGTMAFGDTVDESTATEIVEVALAAGVIEIDTAITYAGGESERMLGHILRGRHDGIRVSSKVGMQAPVEGGPLSASEITRCVRVSVQRLGRPLDTLYLHQPDRSTPLEETVDALASVQAEGLVRRAGVSNHASWQAAELAAACRARGIPVPERAQQIYNPLARGIEVEFLGYAEERHLETVVYNPLAGGLLSGRYSSDDAPADGRFATSALAAMYRDRYWRPEFFDVIDELHDIARDAGMPPAELAMRWVISNPGVDGVLIGTSRPAQMTANLSAVGAGPLDSDVHRAVTDVTERVRGLAPAHAR